jgi:hypothetical protein
MQMFSPLRNRGFYVKFGFLTAVTMKTYLTICNLVESTLPDEPDLKLQAENSLETFVSIYKAKWRLIP